jgi:hypothetical protein
MNESQIILIGSISITIPYNHSPQSPPTRVGDMRSSLCGTKLFLTSQKQQALALDGEGYFFNDDRDVG